jgi:hypothetical protein
MAAHRKAESPLVPPPFCGTPAGYYDYRIHDFFPFKKGAIVPENT